MERTLRCGIRARLFLLIVGFSLLELLIHLYTNAFAGYGIFRDELYYIACAKRLSFGYVDQPPLSIFMLAINRFLFGDSIFALRLMPAVASAFTVFLTGLTVNELKGGAVAVTATLLGLVLAPIFLGINAIFSMNAFDWLIWAALLYIVARLINTENHKLWIWIGVVAGLGLMNKIDVSWFIAGLGVGLFLTPERKYYKTRWPYIAAGIALILFSPYIIWNVNHNFADLEFIRNASRLKYSSVTRLDFVLGQILMNGPTNLPIWLAGIYYFFFTSDGKKFRLLGMIYVVTFLILLINGHSKPEYLSTTLPVLLAGGGIMVQKLSTVRWARWTKQVVPAYLLIGGIIAVPAALPILPVDTYLRYEELMGLKPQTYEGKHLDELPQFYADMFGWENMARTVSQVYTALPPDQQRKAVVFGTNYGEAGAIDFFANKYPLPPVICPHNNFYYWGYGDTTKTVFIVTGGNEADLHRWFSSVTRAGTVTSEYAIPYENNVPIFVCTGAKVSIKDAWPKLKFFI